MRSIIKITLINVLCIAGAVIIAYLLVRQIGPIRPLTQTQLPDFGHMVNTERSVTIPNPLEKYTVNKATMIVRVTIDTFFRRIDERISSLPLSAPTALILIFTVFSTVFCVVKKPIFGLPILLGIVFFDSPLLIFWFLVIGTAFGMVEMVQFQIKHHTLSFRTINSWATTIPTFAVQPKILLVIGIVSFMIRLPYVSSIPTGINGDELLYVSTAQSVLHTGYDRSGTWTPLQLVRFQTPPGEKQAELPYITQLAIQTVIHPSFLSSRIPGIIYGAGIAVMVGGIAMLLFGPVVGILSGILASINPWIFAISRTGYEATGAMFFYMAGLFFLLYAFEKHPHKLDSDIGRLIRYVGISTLCFFLAFASYIGTKPILIPFIMLSLILAVSINPVHTKKPFMYIPLITGIMLTLYYVVSLLTGGASRITEVTGSNLSFGEYLYGVIKKLPQLFSLRYLFMTGDTFFQINRHGLLYIVDFLGIAIGYIALIKKNLCLTFLFLGFLLVGMTPHLIHAPSTSNFTPHITLIFPFLCIVCAYGYVTIVSALPKNNRLLGWMVLGVMYLFSVMNFFHVYFFQYPLEMQADARVSIISKYLSFVPQNTRIRWFSTQGKDAMNKYAFYSGYTVKTMPGTLKGAKQYNDFTYGPVSFESCDPKLIKNDPSTVYIIDPICGPEVSPTTYKKIVRPSDQGELYRIYNDEVCTQLRQTRFLEIRSLQDIFIPKDVDSFCRKFILSDTGI